MILFYYREWDIDKAVSALFQFHYDLILLQQFYARLNDKNGLFQFHYDLILFCLCF